MLYWILVLLISLTAIIIAGCNYHLHDTIAQVPIKMKTIFLNSYDPYGQLTRAVQANLRLNNITLFDSTKHKNNTQPSLYIINSSENKTTTSVFQDGKTAECQITLKVHAQVFIPDKGYYPIDVKVFRSFFDNPLTALAKDAEMDMIRQEMQQQVAQQLVRKLLTIDSTNKTNKALDVKLNQLHQIVAPVS